VDANLRARAVTAAVGLPLLVAVVGWGPEWLFALFVLLVTTAALHEYFSIAIPNRNREQYFGLIFGLALAVVMLAGDPQSLPVSLSAVLMSVFAGYPFMDGDPEERLQRLLRTLLGGCYLGMLLPCWVLLFRQAEGRAWVLWVLIIIMSGDTSAYFVGRYLGGKKLAPQISPGKTVAGAWGYVGFGSVAGTIGAWWLFDRFHWLEALLLSVVMTVLGQLGDLFESWLKRVFSVKDFGAILPGHGGVLDRVDSLIFAAVFTTFYIRFFRS
jgi:phosphatidate cytidylyltransferase